MSEARLTPKQRYWVKKVAEAPVVHCACGCGEEMKSVDNYGRPKQFLTGHNTRKYEDPTQYKREWNHRNREARCQAKKRFFRKRKVSLIQLSGGACLDCGLAYDGHNACLFSFHHLDGSTKSFEIGGAGLINHSWTVILTELKKCVMLCENCHRLRHNGGW